MKDTKHTARLLKVLSVETRIEMLRLLKERSLCVNALAARLALTPGAVSQHLRVMRDAGLVIDEKRGYYVHYRINETTLAAWREAVTKLLDWQPEVRTEKKGTQKCAAAMKNQPVKNRKT